MTFKVENSMQTFLQTNPLTESEVHGRLRELSVKGIQEIVSDNVDRQRYYKEDTQLLAKGVFYFHEYFNALNEKKQTQRLDFFKKNNSFFHGYASPKHFTIAEDAEGPSGKKSVL